MLFNITCGWCMSLSFVWLFWVRNCFFKIMNFLLTDENFLLTFSHNFASNIYFSKCQPILRHINIRNNLFRMLSAQIKNITRLSWHLEGYILSQIHSRDYFRIDVAHFILFRLAIIAMDCFEKLLTPPSV